MVLVDTPGFGEIHVDDAQILHDIGSWLETMYDSQDSHGHKGETKLVGIVYFHDISLERMMGSTLKNVDDLQKLWKQDVAKHVVLCTTKWSDIQQNDGEGRIEQLKQHYWRR